MDIAEATTGPSAPKAPKAKRKANFTARELGVLVEGIAADKWTIMSKLQSSLTVKRKRDVWRQITANVNALGVANRTELDIRKKWKDLKSAVLNQIQNQKKAGRGPADAAPPYADIVMGIIGEKSDMATGIDGKLMLLLSGY